MRDGERQHMGRRSRERRAEEGGRRVCGMVWMVTRARLLTMSDVVRGRGDVERIGRGRGIR